MIKLLDAFKAFITTAATLMALNSDTPLRTLSLLAFMLTTGGLMWFGVEKAFRQQFLA